VLSLFPEFFEPFQTAGVVGKVLSGERKLGQWSVELIPVQLRNFSLGHYKSVDDTLYGGSAGMVIRADVLANGIQWILEQGEYQSREDLEVIFPTPRGPRWDHDLAMELGRSHFKPQGTCFSKDLVFICGRYEGIDERFVQKYVDKMVSIGDYVISGGELATMVMVDGLIRLVPGCLGNNASLRDESFQRPLLDYPVYTKPRVFEEMEVPSVLTSGHHKEIARYQEQKRLELTQKYRPDLLAD
jgi:tRNA (guanine37-N1)-methyltransferase